MRAVAFESYGPPDVLHLSDLPEPVPGPAQVRVRVRAAGVNPFDYKQRSGMMARGVPLDHPVVLGLEASGVVDQVGAGVEGVAVGEEVFGLGSGTYAESALLRAWAPKPAGLGWAEAAGLAVAGETSIRVLDLLALEPGQTLLVHGAAGGVGQTAVHLAVADGLRVIATASERNHDLLRRLGAEPVVYGEGLAARVAALAPNGVHGVFDAAGTQLDDLLTIAGTPNHVVTIANYSAAEQGVRFSGGGGDASAALRKVAALAASGRLTVRVAAAFELADAASAHRLSESRHADGKIVLTVN
jgi:NADPH:quinone reductase-like Zn-dependent oxidoreductase